ncbi:MAG: UDP-N-acetylmuramoyl-tripeptide--D-alanyl-D-alanine ligase [Firmicutes bacterium]|nr:UDP-N-acetylmuramoyl-tripeptide--D-alanyl-D-alanine ligase [Bacillota bacterium]
MPRLTVAQLAQAVEGRHFGSNHDLVVENIVTDSRQVTKGSLFVAIKGENFDGHDFANQAFQQGAAAVLVEKPLDNPLGSYILVEDHIEAMANLGRFCLAKHPVKIIGITGSIGKTSSKEIVAALLGESFKVLKSKGNLNTETGLPITLYSLDESHQVVVLEMGMLGQGEILHLTKIAPPDIAVITNVYGVHLERLGSVKNIAEAKAEIFQGAKDQSYSIYRSQEEYAEILKEKVKDRQLTYGLDSSNDIYLENLCLMGLKGSEFDLIFPGQVKVKTKIALPGQHMAENAILAAAVAYALGLSPESIAENLKNSSFIEQRSEIVRLKGNRLILNDCYNASPASMDAALKLMEELREDRSTLVVLGDMKELGEDEIKAHINLGERFADSAYDTIITKGPLAELSGKIAAAREKSNLKHLNFTNNQEIIEALYGQLPENSLLLIKGSRSLALETILPALKDFWGEQDE